MQIDLSRPRDRRILVAFVTGSLVFIMLSAVGTYNAFNFTESVQFCGETCHKVMKPELTHARPRAPRARGLCGMPCGAGRLVVCEVENLRLLPALRRRVQQISAPDSHADQKPASRAGDLRAMPLAAIVHRQSGPHVQLFPERRRPIRLTPSACSSKSAAGTRRPGRLAASTGTSSPATRWNTSPPTRRARKFRGCA